MNDCELLDIAYYIISRAKTYKEELQVKNRQLYDIVTMVCLIGVPMLEKRPKVPKFEEVYKIDGKESEVSKERSVLEERIKMYKQYHGIK